MKKINQKIAPLFIMGVAIFFLGTAYKFVFSKKHDTSDEIKKQEPNKADASEKVDES